MPNPFNKSPKISSARTFQSADLILQQSAERIQWNPTLYRDRQVSNAHWGQLKLCLTLIEFIITNVKYNPEKTVRIVYAGAANGRGTSVVARLFPWIQFDLFDSNEFYDDLFSLDNVSLIKRYFTDNDALIYLRISNEDYVQGHEMRAEFGQFCKRASSLASEDIYFVSDIRRNTNKSFQNEMANSSSELYQRFVRERSNTIDTDQAKRIFIENETEKSIKEDMQMQQKWVELMNPIACQLKFRLPYAIAGAPRTFEYLDGIVYFQPFIGKTSSETRLVSVRSASGYLRKSYDILTYEQNLFAHNIHRMSTKYRNILTGKLEHYIETELINDYDCTCAAFILKECFFSLHNRYPSSLELASFYISICTKLVTNMDISSVTRGEGTLAKLYSGSIKISGLGADEIHSQTTSTQRIGYIETVKRPVIPTIRLSLPL